MYKISLHACELLRGVVDQTEYPRVLYIGKTSGSATPSGPISVQRQREERIVDDAVIIERSERNAGSIYRTVFVLRKRCSTAELRRLDCGF